MMHPGPSAIRRVALLVLLAIAALALSVPQARAQGCFPEQTWNPYWAACIPASDPICLQNAVEPFEGVCITCVGLTVPNSNHTACVTCPAGSHPSSDGAECVVSGGQCNTSSTKMKCPRNDSCETVLPQSGGTAALGQCVEDCKRGFTMDDARQCQPICKGYGEYYTGQFVNNPTICRRCSDGTVVNADRASCGACPSGQVPSPSQEYCITPGTCSWPQVYSEAAAANPCVNCPPGFVGDEEGLGWCRVDCRGGSGYDPWSQGCYPCTGATVSDDHGVACVPCQQGIPAANHSACVGCMAGSAPNSTHSGCVACRGNTESFDGMGCVPCAKPWKANASHTKCNTPVNINTPRTSKPILTQPGGPVMSPLRPGLLEGGPGLGGHGPAGAGSPIRGGPAGGAR
jgi:hypothetical protein